MPTTVLLTGGTGSLGASTLVQLMADPEINVIAVLRSLSKSEAFLRTKYAAQVSSGRLSFVEISDMTTPNSFDEAASNANAIIHIATPVAYTDLLERMIKPSWPIVHNVLTAAEKSARVKRVIVTGSMVSTMKIPEDLFSGQVITEESWNPIPFEAADANPRNAYQYSKVYAEQKAWDFMKEEPRHFDLIVLLAPSITGKSVQEGFQPKRGILVGSRAFTECSTARSLIPCIHSSWMSRMWPEYISSVFHRLCQGTRDICFIRLSCWQSMTLHVRFERIFPNFEAVFKLPKRAQIADCPPTSSRQTFPSLKRSLAHNGSQPGNR